MNEIDDPLWDPRQRGDEGLQQLQQVLAPYSAEARGLRGRSLPARAQQRSPRWRPRLLIASAAALVASVVLAVCLGWRFDWPEGQAWTVHAGAVAATAIQPGQSLHTASDQQVEIDVARIGRIALSANSSLSLIETRRGFHRVRLEHGHLRARIWAPPGWFGISSGAAEVVDLGCDFDLWKQADGSGRVSVRTGWIAYDMGTEQVLVPAGFQMHFDADRAYTPRRSQADPAFQKTLVELDQVLGQSGAGSAEAERVASRLAQLADARDGFSLLSLLTRHPVLARTPLYPRLMQSQRLPASDAHRHAWIAGDIAAINQGWSALPRPPKAWWWHWADAF